MLHNFEDHRCESTKGARRVLLLSSCSQMARPLLRMEKRQNSVAGLWFLLFALALLSPLRRAIASEATNDEIDLDSLSDLELEEICTLRGFELVKEDISSHDDYVEAARQCLAIERDMEEIIAEHPEILKELEEERDRMMEEKERLEKELAEAEKQRNVTKNLHTAFIPDTQKTSEDEEVVNLDLESESEFDVIGHQEPLSDTRVQNETLLQNSSTMGPHETDLHVSPPMVDSSSSTDETQQAIKEKEMNVHVEIWTEMREKIASDFNLVANIVFPKAIRGPVKAILKSAGKIAKQMGMDLYQFVKRHVMAFIERRKNQTTETEHDETAASIAST